MIYIRNKMISLLNISIIIIVIIILVFVYKNLKQPSKSKFTNEKIVKRAEIIKRYLDNNKEIPSFNDFKSSVTDTDVVEWSDVRGFTDKTNLDTIIKSLS